MDKFTEYYNLMKETKGRIFSLLFYKKSTGELRKMVARTGVTKFITGKGMNYDAKEKGLITIYDMEKKGYRNIPVSNVLEMKFNNNIVEDKQAKLQYLQKTLIALEAKGNDELEILFEVNKIKEQLKLDNSALKELYDKKWIIEL